MKLKQLGTPRVLSPMVHFKQVRTPTVSIPHSLIMYRKQWGQQKHCPSCAYLHAITNIEIVNSKIIEHNGSYTTSRRTMSHVPPGTRVLYPIVHLKQCGHQSIVLHCAYLDPTFYKSPNQFPVISSI